MVNGFRAFSNPSSFCLKDVKVLETDKKVAPKMDGATLSFSRTGAKLGAVLTSGTYIWNSQSGISFTSGPSCSKLGLNNPGLLRDLNSDLKA